MKKITFIIIITLIVNFAFAQEPIKAYGTINFGMTKSEIKKAVKTDDNLKIISGKIITEIFGEKYFGAFDYEKGKMERLWLHHYQANLAGYHRKYNVYTINRLEGDLDKIYKFFTEQYGEPISPFKYTHPADIDPFGFSICSTWIDGERIIMLYERSYNSVVYPQISLLTKSYFDKVVDNQTEIMEEDKQQTKEMFK